jgi:hypothetical protein|tara:strand:- start:739 stop:1386 length:648 start_codon:yes stop_codon:yes gene_type:complete
MSFTYSGLKTAIQDYTENEETSFVSHLNDFIELTEERILKTVQLDLFKKNVSGTFTSSNQFLTAPTDYLAPFSLSATSSSNKIFLDYKDATFIQTVNPNSSTTGTPKYYGIYDVDTFIIAPTPDSSYAAELHYFFRPASLTAAGDSGTTWLSENAKFCLLYGCLVEAYTYMKGEADILAEYNKRFSEAVIALKMFGEAKEPQDIYRTGQVIRQRQ